MVKISAIALLCVLASCAEKEIVNKPVQVDVPVTVPCHAPAVAQPVWAVQAVTVKATMYDRVKALLVDNSQHTAYEGQLEAAVTSCQ